MKLRSLANPVVSLGIAIALVGGTGVATAATGGSFILGRSNAATTQTFLTNPNGPALGLTSKAGTPPFTIGNTVKVPRLNADLLDNLDSAALQRRIAAACPGGAISAVSATGAVTCATLPKKINVAAPLGDTVVATLDGFTVHVACTRYDGSPEVDRLGAFVYLTGSGAMNGHSTTTSYSGDQFFDPVGTTIFASGTFSKLRVLDAPDGAYSRQTSTLMVVRDGVLTQLTLHLFADARDLAGKPCTVWGTAI
jgi:hypothetical protein